MVTATCCPGLNSCQIEFINLDGHLETGIAVDLTKMLAAGFLFADMRVERGENAVRWRAHSQCIELVFSGG